MEDPDQALLKDSRAFLMREFHKSRQSFFSREGSIG